MSTNAENQVAQQVHDALTGSDRRSTMNSPASDALITRRTANLLAELTAVLVESGAVSADRLASILGKLTD